MEIKPAQSHGMPVSLNARGSFARPAPIHRQRFVGEPVMSTSMPAVPVKIPAQPRIDTAIQQPLRTHKPVTIPKPAATRALPTDAKSAHARQTRSEVLQRHAVHKSATKVHKQTRRRMKRETMLHVLSAVAFTIGVLSTLVNLYTMRNGHIVQSSVFTPLVKQSDDNDPAEMVGNSPNEQAPTMNTVKKYAVANDEPKYLKLAKLNVFARVRSVSLKPDGSIGMPANIFDAGWYRDGAKLGGTGAAVIDGHTAGPTQDGLFANLKTLQEGDFISVTRGDNSEFVYKVVSVKTFDPAKIDITKLRDSIQPGKSGLNLTTLSDESGKNQRLVVYAVEVQK